MEWFRVMKRLRQFISPVAKLFFKRLSRVDSGPAKGLRFDHGPAAAGFISGNYEPPVQEAVASLVRQGEIFYDIGANVGFFSVLAGRLVGPGGGIYAFEPVPENASMVKKNAFLNDFENIQVLEIAVSSHTGKSELLLAHYAGGAVLKSAGVPPDFSGRMVVETMTIDDLVKLKKIRPPNIVKIDVEGAELEVLYGMLETLREWGPRMIIEVDDAVEVKCMEKLSACRELLQGFHYRCEVLPNSYRDGNWFVRHLVAQR